MFIGEENSLIANVYAPNGTIRFGEGAIGTGAFIAKRVIVDDEVELSHQWGFVLDDTPPVLEILSPEDSLVTNQTSIVFHLLPHFYLPVCPKPPASLTVSVNSSVSTKFILYTL